MTRARKKPSRGGGNHQKKFDKYLAIGTRGWTNIGLHKHLIFSQHQGLLLLNIHPAFLSFLPRSNIECAWETVVICQLIHRFDGSCLCTFVPTAFPFHWLHEILTLRFLRWHVPLVCFDILTFDVLSILAPWTSSILSLTALLSTLLSFLVFHAERLCYRVRSCPRRMPHIAFAEIVVRSDLGDRFPEVGLVAHPADAKTQIEMPLLLRSASISVVSRRCS